MSLSCTVSVIQQDIGRKSPIATYPCLAPPLGVNLLEFRRDLWRQQTRVPELSYNVVCVILGLAVLVEH